MSDRALKSDSSHEQGTPVTAGQLSQASCSKYLWSCNLSLLSIVLLIARSRILALCSDFTTSSRYPSRSPRSSLIGASWWPTYIKTFISHELRWVTMVLVQWIPVINVAGTMLWVNLSSSMKLVLSKHVIYIKMLDLETNSRSCMKCKAKALDTNIARWKARKALRAQVWRLQAWN